MANYGGSVGGMDNDDGSKQFERYENFLVFGGIKERGLAEQAYNSILAYASGDIAEGEGGGGRLISPLLCDFQ